MLAVGDPFIDSLQRWRLRPDGKPLSTHSSHLLPVRLEDSRAAMLKVSFEKDEKAGATLMRWWDGDGAARVYAHRGDALLMERAEGPDSLMRMALDGRDDEASRIACAVVARLHASRDKPLPRLVPLTDWFAALWPVADREGGILAACATTAHELLRSPRDPVTLHGDIHHRNILDFGARGWCAIDPKCLFGERGFDYANLLCNPELPAVTDRVRLERQSFVIAEAAGLDRRRLLQWTMAYAGLSVAWFIEDDDRSGARPGLIVASLARQCLA